MRSLKIQQYKKIKNSPMRSPSPDYACKNRTPRTNEPLQEIQQKNNIISISPVKFPVVPSELMKKKQKKQIENIAPSAEKYQTPTKSTTTSKLNRQISAPIQQITSFQPIIEQINQIQVNQIAKKVQQIYNILFPSLAEKELMKRKYSLDLSSYIVHTNEKLDQIKQQIQKIAKLRENSVSFQGNFKTFGYNQSNIRHNIQKKMNFVKSQNNDQGVINDSPIKVPGHQQQSSFSIFQLNQLQTQNSKLRRQVIVLKLQLQGSQKRNYSTSKLSDLVQKSPSKSSLKSDVGVRKYRLNMMKEVVEGNIKQLSESPSMKSQTTYKFMKQKIGYLQGQLQNKMDRVTLIEKEKNQQIKILREKLNNANRLIQIQMDNYKKVIESQKEKIRNLQQTNKQFQTKRDFQGFQISSQQKTVSKQTRQRRNSEQITYKIQIHPQMPTITQIRKANKFPQRKDLFWDQDEIISIQQDHEKQQSLFSEAQRVDIEQIFSVKKQFGHQVQKMKKHYEDVIQQNLKNHYNELHSFQSQLRQLKQFIKNQNLEQYHTSCANCQQLSNRILQKQIQITDLEVQINILKQQVQQEKKQTKKIRNLLSKATKIQRSNSQQSERRFKRKSKLVNKSQILASQKSINSKKESQQDLGHSFVRTISLQRQFEEQDI